MNKKLNGALVAAAVAGLFLAGKVIAQEQPSPTEEAKVHCMGVNECKGKGWISTATEQECTDKGGTVMQEAPAGEVPAEEPATEEPAQE